MLAIGSSGRSLPVSWDAHKVTNCNSSVTAEGILCIYLYIYVFLIQLPTRMHSRQDSGKDLIRESVLYVYNSRSSVKRVALVTAEAGHKINKDQLSRHLTPTAAGVFQ